jgi:toxin FitB
VNRYLLDTNIISELRKQRPHGAVLAWFNQLKEEQVFVSALTIGELQAGIERTRTQDERKAKEIELWVEQLAESLAILPMDVACFREWARLMHTKSDRLLEDAMIAATARVHQLTVATRNERDFAHFGVPIVNPFIWARM